MWVLETVDCKWMKYIRPCLSGAALNQTEPKASPAPAGSSSRIPGPPIRVPRPPPPPQVPPHLHPVLPEGGPRQDVGQAAPGGALGPVAHPHRGPVRCAGPQGPAEAGQDPWGCVGIRLFFFFFCFFYFSKTRNTPWWRWVGLGLNPPRGSQARGVGMVSGAKHQKILGNAFRQPVF